ncbi:hypothetical protein EK21DRAFT_57155 [Setomelanomma holmii]|uniref:Required for respiratory growth protein 7, mitochondrial n=1 Tax=Setomelanomma holmii TaxID=210430 RepID=A0A9P4HGP6_9PLEO|nr:hypothetical protein EK21DRAFT_57155 [Setomelanomma holmii]
MRLFLRPPWQIPLQLHRWQPRAPRSIPRRIATTSATNAAPIDIPKLILSPGSPHHNSLPTFLEYAKRAKLAPTRTVYIGTHYEYTVALALMRLGFSLLRIGKKFDAGIDLIGHWALAPLREPMRIIIQCKARQGSIYPNTMREMEGSFQGVPPDWRNKDVLGLLVTTNKATKGTLEALGQSRHPMGFVMVSKDGTVQQFKSQAKFRNAGTKRDIQMTWMGTPISADRNELDQDTLDLLQLVKPDAPVRHVVRKSPAGRKKTMHRAPAPRGGLVTGKRGRPSASRKASAAEIEVTLDDAAIEVPVIEVPRKRGRPKGSENQPKRGRPQGSKNRPKAILDAG